MSNLIRQEHHRLIHTHVIGWVVAVTALLAVIALTLFCARETLEDLKLQAAWPAYHHILENLHLPASWWRWVLGDISEVAFYKHEFASIGLIAGAGLAYWAGQNGKAWGGFPICYGTGLWPWLFLSSLMGLLLSNLLWGWTLFAREWQPTFVAFVSLPAAMVLLFGGGWKVAMTGAVMGAVLVTPAALVIVDYLCKPLALPMVVGNVLGMASASVVAFLLCRRWPQLVTVSQPTLPVRKPVQPVEQSQHGALWTVRRILADFSEAPFFGNELASLGLLLGAGLAFAVNPESPAYGSGLLPELITAQLLAASIGVLVWRKQWITRGWYPTYIPLVSVVPAAVLIHGAGIGVMLVSAVLGALIAPPLATAMAARLPQDVHPYVANVLSMAISTLLIVPVAGMVAGLG